MKKAVVRLPFFIFSPMRSIAALFLLLIASCSDGQRTVVITSLPENTPDGDPIHLAGDPNGWNPGDPDWVFQEEDELLFFEIPEEVADIFDGKITRGSWSTVEGNASGGFLPDRTFNFTNSDTVFIEVLTWEGNVPTDDLPENLEVFDEDFYMPQLDRTRRIRVLLPNDYYETSLYYPVLYMHDGQNLFSDQESFAGEWEIDEAMLAFENEGYEGAIVVAIDNGGAERIAEYTPYAHPQYGGGDGDAYVEFLVNTLKPAIDEEYRTLSDRDHTGIMGSSLGGLISFYAGMKYQDVFSKVGVFSPSFWFSDSIYDFAQTTGKSEEMKFYFLAGGQEGQDLEPQVNEMMDILETEGFEDEEMVFEFVPDGEHSEWFWAQEFPQAFEWLYLNSTLTAVEEEHGQSLIYPNPAGEFILMELNSPGSSNWMIFDMTGRMIRQGVASGSLKINISEIPAGMYQLMLKGAEDSAGYRFVKGL